MATEDEEIGPTLTSPYPCFLKSPSIVPESSPLLGSESMEKLEFEDFMNYDKKAWEMEEGDNGLNEKYIPTELRMPITSDLKGELNFPKLDLSTKCTRSSGFKPSDIYSYMSTEVGVSCTCRKFEFHGILCSHALKLFCDLQYESLPPQYYLKRWTRTIVDEDVFDIHGDLIPNDTDPSLTLRYSDLSQISQRIVTKGSKFPEVSSLTKAGLLELEAKVDSWVSSKSAVQNDASKAQSTSTLNVDVEAPLRDPAKRKRRGQGNKRKRGPLEGKLPKKKTPCKRKGDKGEDSTTEAMTKTSQPFKEVEQDENIHDTTSAQGPHVEQPNMAQRSPFQSRIMEANVGLNGLQVPNSSCTSWRASHPTFTEMLLGEDREIEESLGDGGFETCFDNVMSNQEAVDSIKSIKDAESAAKHLIDEALSRKSRDDISCIVVKFQ
ncbi:hypothetical protein Vadar_013525 [Vaccinium darrowii]|uniref:Uncharacterized protein n=1 Tax=Vaccinium darrowii TaxID=229202 RepID=A0ACB7X0X4_9ERIC|nr:hypothetical protein Vadar_013525 [Vaccinium darrowii]